MGPSPMLTILLDCFRSLSVLAASDISFLMSLSCFSSHRGLSSPVGDTYARELIRCGVSYLISAAKCFEDNVSNVARMLILYRDLPITNFQSNFWELETLKKSNTECACVALISV